MAKKQRRQHRRPLAAVSDNRRQEGTRQAAQKACVNPSKPDVADQVLGMSSADAHLTAKTSHTKTLGADSLHSDGQQAAHQLEDRRHGRRTGSRGRSVFSRRSGSRSNQRKRHNAKRGRKHFAPINEMAENAVQQVQAEDQPVEQQSDLTSAAVDLVPSEGDAMLADEQMHAPPLASIASFLMDGEVDLSEAGTLSTDASPSSTEGDLHPGTLTKNVLSSKLFRVIKEFVQTERSYCDDLVLVTELFYQPLCQGSMTLLLEPSLREQIFLNMSQLARTTKELARDLEHAVALMEQQALGRRHTATPTHVCLGDVLLRHLDYYAAHETYCKQQEQSCRVLAGVRRTNRDLDGWLHSKEQHRSCRGLRLDDFLLQPVQRVPRHLLLLRQATEGWPKDLVASGTEELGEAMRIVDTYLKRIDAAASIFNSDVTALHVLRLVAATARKRGSIDGILDAQADPLTSHRKVVCEGLLDLTSATTALGIKRRLQCRVYLFHDMLVVASDGTSARRPSLWRNRFSRSRKSSHSFLHRSSSRRKDRRRATTSEATAGKSLRRQKDDSQGAGTQLNDPVRNTVPTATASSAVDTIFDSSGDADWDTFDGSVRWTEEEHMRRVSEIDSARSMLPASQDSTKLLLDPWLLANVIVVGQPSCTASETLIEVVHIESDTSLVLDAHSLENKQYWLTNLQQACAGCGRWRRRRGATQMQPHELDRLSGTENAGSSLRRQQEQDASAISAKSSSPAVDRLARADIVSDAGDGLHYLSQTPVAPSRHNPVPTPRIATVVQRRMSRRDWMSGLVHSCGQLITPGRDAAAAVSSGLSQVDDSSLLRAAARNGTSMEQAPALKLRSHGLDAAGAATPILGSRRMSIRRRSVQLDTSPVSAKVSCDALQHHQSAEEKDDDFSDIELGLRRLIEPLSFEDDDDESVVPNSRASASGSFGPGSSSGRTASKGLVPPQLVLQDLSSSASSGAATPTMAPSSPLTSAMGGDAWADLCTPRASQGEHGTLYGLHTNGTGSRNDDGEYVDIGDVHEKNCGTSKADLWSDGAPQISDLSLQHDDGGDDDYMASLEGLRRLACGQDESPKTPEDGYVFVYPEIARQERLPTTNWESDVQSGPVVTCVVRPDGSLHHAFESAV